MVTLLINLLFIALIGYLAYWLVTHFFPKPVRTVALVIVGVILLLALLGLLGIVPGWPALAL